ncbi:hypothetical protein ACNHYB_01170 [Isoptericola jiangsuensis]|uniref:hypothetical protein n=1 Tax=Isoptericola jiangsuensis TaxID=548579 RepID=UPI003AAE1611
MSPATGHPRSARVLRGAIVATAATGVALASHVAGGAAMPGPAGVLAPWAISLWVCTLLAGRRPARWRTTASVAASQVLFHVLFVLGTPTGSAPDHTHHHGALVPFTPSTATADLVRADATMWAWHAAAAAATVVLLYRGEVVLAHLRGLTARLVARFVPRPAPSAPVVAPRARAHVTLVAPRPTAPGPQVAPLRRRGPPLLPAH